MRRRVKALIALLLTIGLLSTACANGGSGAGSGARYADRAGNHLTSDGPNIVFILTDDLTWNLVKHMSAVRKMQRNGTTFDNFFTADSLCCPSRASILTGLYPHNTHVRVNEAYRGGGHQAFILHGNDKRTFGIPLDQAGYRTGFIGKYINGYRIDKDAVPPGWDEWHVSRGAYDNVAGTYPTTNITEKGDARHIRRADAYTNDLYGRRARNLVNTANRHDRPFFLELSSFAPHHRVGSKGPEPKFPPAMRDRPKVKWPNGQYRFGDCGTNDRGKRFDCRDLEVPRGTGFSKKTYQKLDVRYRNRVRMMQSLNDQIIRLREQLARNGQLSNTYFVFSSDNGFHLGEHGLKHGKGTAYDHDTRVPLIVQGPGVRKGVVRHEITQTVDLHATFTEMAGLKPKRTDGRSLLPLLRGKRPSWRSAALFEHKAQERGGNPLADPDLGGDRGNATRNGFVPSYHPFNAIRTKDWLYVEYLDSDRRELYNLRKDPGQKHNVYERRPRRAAELSRWLGVYTDCGKEDTTSCWQAGNRPH